jgi:hypothetical protein
VARGTAPSQGAKQGQQRLKAFARRPRVQGTAMASVEIDRIAGLPTMRRDGFRLMQHGSIPLLSRPAGRAVKTGELATQSA